MGNIVNDIVDDINIKPKKSKLIIKLLISVASSLIVLAFLFGQIKSSFFNRIDGFENSLDKNTTTVEQMERKMIDGFERVDLRINKMYTDGFEAFDDYQQFNKKQLILVLDYGQTNKELLKEMLDLNMQEKTKSVESQLYQAMTVPVVMKKSEFSIGVKPSNSKNYIKMVHFIEVGSNDTIFHLTGTTKDFINKIDRKKYEVGAIIENSIYSDLYDLSYRNK